MPEEKQLTEKESLELERIARMSMNEAKEVLLNKIETDLKGEYVQKIKEYEERTKNDSDNGDAPRFKVTLGVIPDYAFEGEGMRIDGVSDGRPASKAGLKAGDVVVQLGDYKVTDMTSYMKALSMFKKEDTTSVKVKREDKELKFDVTF